jgi:hypothetical protein
MRLQRAIDSSQRNYLHALKALQQLQSARGQSSQTEDTKPSTGQLASFRKHPASAASVEPEQAPPSAHLANRFFQTAAAPETLLPLRQLNLGGANPSGDAVADSLEFDAARH